MYRNLVCAFIQCSLYCILSRFMGSRSRPHRVLSVCVCVCVSRCLWVRVIEANSLQLRVITIGLYQFLSRSLLSDPCSLRSTFTRRFWFLVSAIPEPCFPGLRSPETRLPIASLRYPPQPLRKAPFCLRKAPLLPTESSALPTEAPPLPTESSV